MEGLLVSFAFLILPFIILYVLAKILPPWGKREPGTGNGIKLALRGVQSV